MAVCRADGIDVPLSGQKDSNLIHKNYACHFIVCSEDLAVQAIAIDVRTSLMQFLNLLFFCSCRFAGKSALFGAIIK